MPITIGAKLDSPFTEPLGLLSDCHRRIEKFLDQLLAITAELKGATLDASRQAAMETALRYFQRAAPLHTQDEEASLFPRLRAMETDEAREALKALDALESDHRAADEAHAEIDSLGWKWVEDGSLPEDEAARLLNLLTTLREVYRKHIAVEDNQVFPLAGRGLEGSELALLGREMAVRRGLDPDRLPSVSHCTLRKEGRIAS
jgi:iron-sulfur cluster repair protein YtfE (RIC family)